MRIATPCSENLPSMPRVPGGVHCARCDRNVLDLRRVPRRRALAILSEKRTSEGRVCAWVRATEDGTPVFASEPSRIARFIAPALVVGTLAACTPEASSTHTSSTPVTLGHASSGGDASNANALTQGPLRPISTVVPTPSAPPLRPASNVQPVLIETAGDMAW